METNWYQVIATILSPVIAGLIIWLITKGYQKNKEQFIAKYDIFKLLYAARDTRLFGEPRVANLNLIPVIFAKNRKVIDAYKEYFNFTQINGVDENLLKNKYLLILEEIAKVINLKISIDSLNSIYFPDHLYLPLMQKNEIDRELLRVLKNTESLILNKKENIESIDNN